MFRRVLMLMAAGSWMGKTAVSIQMETVWPAWRVLLLSAARAGPALKPAPERKPLVYVHAFLLPLNFAKWAVAASTTMAFVVGSLQQSLKFVVFALTVRCDSVEEGVVPCWPNLSSLSSQWG
jgi:hypothetical protein